MMRVWNRVCGKRRGSIETHQSQDTDNETGCLNSPFQDIRCFVFTLCCLGFVEGISANGLVNIGLTSIETRFNLRSSQAGVIVSCGNFGGVIFVLFVSFYGGLMHKPRVVGFGSLVLALGCFLFFLPHFLVGPYTYTTEKSTKEMLLCDGRKANVCATVDNFQSSGSDSRFLPMFAFANGIQGAGFTPVFTVACAYIDANTNSGKTAFYVGLLYMSTAAGVAFGYVLGGQLLRVWVDVDKADHFRPDINNSDRRWVGAWWLGFVITFVLYVVITPLMCAFPREIKAPHNEGTNDKASPPMASHKIGPEANHDKGIVDVILMLPRTLLHVVRNKVLILLILAGSAETLLAGGTSAFSAKIIKAKFKVSAAIAGFILGCAVVLGGGGGMVLSGFIIRKQKLSLRGIVRMCLATILPASLSGAAFFIYCSEAGFAGVNEPYHNTSLRLPPAGLTVPCNAQCMCTTMNFDPVCGTDGLTYFSACHAGCQYQNISHSATGQDEEILSNCTCVGDEEPEARKGECVAACELVWLFAILLLIGMFTTCMNTTPISVAVLRLVPAEERSLGLGFLFLCLRILGAIPGPILTGHVIDNACDLWRTTCEGRGSCWIHSNMGMGWRLFTWWITFKAVSLITLLLAHYLLPPDTAAVQTGEENFQTASAAEGPENRYR